MGCKLLQIRMMYAVSLAATLAAGQFASAGPNMMAIGDYGSVPFKRAEGKISYSGREIIFSFDDPQFDFGRVVVRSTQPLSVVKRDLFVGFDGKTIRIDKQGAPGANIQIQEVEIWLRIQGKIRPGFNYEWEIEVSGGRDEEVEGFQALIPMLWADGEPLASEVTISSPEVEDTDRIQRLLLPHGVVKVKQFESQTGEAWVVLKPRTLGNVFGVGRFSFREVDNDPKSDAKSTMPVPVRYIEIRSALEDEIAAALSRGTEALKKQQTAEHFWPGSDVEQSVLTTCSVIAALATQDPTEERVQKAVEWVGRQAPQKGQSWGVPTTAAQLGVLSRWGGMASHGPFIQKNVLFLTDAQNEDGGWGQRSRKEAANAIAQASNHTISLDVLSSLAGARRAGAEPEKQVWKKALQYWTDAQIYDGGFNQKLSSYGGVGSPPASPYTVMGATGLIQALDMNASYGSKRCNTYMSNSEQIRGIERALGWLQKNFRREADLIADFSEPIDPLFEPGYLVSLAGVGGLTELNGKRTFEEGAKELMGHYDPASGLFGVRGPNNQFAQAPSVGRTAAALSILANGAAPTICQRIIVGDAETNRAQLRGDANHLVDWISAKRGRTYNWRRASIEQDVRTLVEAPITLLNFVGPSNWTDKEWAKVREYCFAGGTVVVDVSDDTQRAGVAAEIQKAFPEYTFADVAADAPVLSAEKEKASVSGLKALSNGFRMFLFLPSQSWSCAWHMNQVADAKDSFQFMNNLLTYATDGQPPRSSFIGSTYALASSPARTMKGCRLQVGSTIPAYPNLLETMNRLMQANFRTEVALVESPAEADVIWVNVTGDAAPQGKDRDRLAAALRAGKFVLIDVVSGNEKWDESFRSMLRELDPSVRIEKLRRNDPIYSGEIAGTLGFDASRVRFRKSLQTRLAKSGRCELWTLIREDKPIGVYSTYDLSSGIAYHLYPGCRGIVPEDARALSMNAFLAAYEWKTHGKPQA